MDWITVMPEFVFLAILFPIAAWIVRHVQTPQLYVRLGCEGYPATLLQVLVHNPSQQREVGGVRLSLTLFDTRFDITPSVKCFIGPGSLCQVFWLQLGEDVRIDIVPQVPLRGRRTWLFSMALPQEIATSRIDCEVKPKPWWSGNSSLSVRRRTNGKLDSTPLKTYHGSLFAGFSVLSAFLVGALVLLFMEWGSSVESRMGWQSWDRWIPLLEYTLIFAIFALILGVLLAPTEPSVALGYRNPQNVIAKEKASLQDHLDPRYAGTVEQINQ